MIDIKEYHEDRTIVSSTGLKEAAKSKRHFAYYLEHGGESKAVFDIGNAFELYLIDVVKDTNNFGKEVFVFDELARPEPDMTFGSTLNKEWKLKQLDRASATGRYIITNDDFEMIKAMTEACIKDKLILAMLQHTEYQESLFWTCPETGVKCKTRPDITKRKKNVVIDIKTAQSAAPGSFIRDIKRYNYPTQATMQMQGVINSGRMEKVDDYFWLAVGKDKPYTAQLYRFSHETWEYHLRKYYGLLGDCKDVLESGLHYSEYPGYGNPDIDMGIIDVEV